MTNTRNYLPQSSLSGWVGGETQNFIIEMETNHRLSEHGLKLLQRQSKEEGSLISARQQIKPTKQQQSWETGRQRRSLWAAEAKHHHNTRKILILLNIPCPPQETEL